MMEGILEAPLPEVPVLVQEELAALVLRTVQEVVTELRPGRAPEVRLDSSLEKELGLDSLARTEVLWRLGQALERTLPEAALAESETPRDILRCALRGEAPARVPASSPILSSKGVGVPDQAETLVEVLEFHASAHPDRRHIHFEEDGSELTYGALRDGGLRVAAGLQGRGIGAGQCVALMLPTGKDYFLAFFGVMLAGAVPVPIYPPSRPSQIEEHLRRHGALLENAQARLLITVAEAKPLAHLLASLAKEVQGVATLADLCGGATESRPPAIGPRDTAFLQYTSGSTGNPKGVIVSHAGVLANIRAMGRAVGLNAEDVVVSWLPLYHDMGLIGAWLCSLYFAFPLVVMSPLAFLAQPARWLWAIHRHRATLTAAPNFAYELCLRKLQDRELEGLDLGSLRYACNGAEPVQASTMEGFARRFQAWGLGEGALAPVYGLAEATLDLTMPPPGRALRIDRVQRETFQDSRFALPAAAEDPEALRFVGCGLPIPGHQLRVVDEGGREVGNREVGRLQFKGPSATSGYFRNPVRTADLFAGDWLETGDYAYLADGELFLSGRAKDLIIRGGRNYYPYELEGAVGSLSGVRRGCVAVFGCPDPASGTERLVVVAETRERDPEVLEPLRARIQELSLECLGAPAEEILLVKPHTVLKTSSGKLRRSACRDLYLQGALGRSRHPFLQMASLFAAGLGSWAGDLARRAGQALHGVRTALALALILLPVWVASLLAPGRCWGFVHRSAQAFLRMAGIPLDVQGMDRLVPGPCVVVVNHASYLDSLVLLALFKRPFAFVTKGELAPNPVLGPFLRGLGVAFVERFDPVKGVEDTGRLTRLLAEGQSLIWFPEGTFQRAPGLLPFRLGAFQAAVQSGAAVQPVALRGTRSILRDGSWMARRGGVQAEVLEPLRADGADWAAALRLCHATRAALLAHCGEPDMGEEIPALFAADR